MAGPAFLVTAQVHSEMRFEELKRAVEMSVNAALVKGAELTLNAVVAAETRVGDASPKRRVSPGVHLRDSFHVTVRHAFGRTFGFGDIIVWTENPNAIWQELGTRGSRRKRLKSGELNFRDHSSGNRGVKPLYFMRRGLRRAFPEVEALIVASLQGIGEFGGGSTLVDTTSPNYLRHG